MSTVDAFSYMPPSTHSVSPISYLHYPATIPDPNSIHTTALSVPSATLSPPCIFSAVISHLSMNAAMSSTGKV
jgi:hypothetical protein